MKNDVRGRRLARTVLLLPLLAMLVQACPRRAGTIGLELRDSGRFDAEWRRYLALDPHKSLAFSGDLEGRFVLGYSHDEASEGVAVENALADCRSRRTDRRIEDECRTIAVDDELVEEHEQAALHED